MSSTLVDILGQGDPSAPALILGSGGAKFTRQQVHQAAVQLAHTLRSSGVSPGDVVTIAEPNTVDNVVIFLGVTYARAVAAPLNQNYTKVTSTDIHPIQSISLISSLLKTLSDDANINTFFPFQNICYF